MKWQTVPQMWTSSSEGSISCGLNQNIQHATYTLYSGTHIYIRIREMITNNKGFYSSLLQPGQI